MAANVSELDPDAVLSLRSSIEEDEPGWVERVKPPVSRVPAQRGVDCLLGRGTAAGDRCNPPEPPRAWGS